MLKILKVKNKKVLKTVWTSALSMAIGVLRDVNRIDWIKEGYLNLEYNDPCLFFEVVGDRTETYAEGMQKLVKLLGGKDYSYVHELKDRNRGMILLLIEKIKQTGNARFIPILKAWKEIEYKKVQAEIQRVIDYLIKEGTVF